MLILNINLSLASVRHFFLNHDNKINLWNLLVFSAKLLTYRDANVRIFQNVWREAKKNGNVEWLRFLSIELESHTGKYLCKKVKKYVRKM